MTYKEAREYLHSIEKSRGINLGLTRMEQLMEKLGNPEKGLNVLHAAGTNGKGSVLAFLESILLDCGYHIVRYSSPSVFCYLECLTENGENINEERFARLTEKVKNAADQMLHEGKEQPTLYELETAMAFLFAKETECDFMLLETCMGGRMDATNIVPEVCLSIITSISMDHMQFLGDTKEKIAGEKAGIIKRGCPVVVSCHNKNLAEVFEKAAAEKKSPLVWGEEKIPYRLGLLGVHQQGNAGTALSAIQVLRKKGFDIPEKSVAYGFENVRWPGRFEKINSDPVCILDGAHNPDAARFLGETLIQLTEENKIPKQKYFVMGIFKDKDYEEIVRQTVHLADTAYTITPKGERGLPAECLTACVERYNRNVYTMGDVESALNAAFGSAKRNHGMVICFGSLSFLGEAREVIEKLSQV